MSLLAHHCEAALVQLAQLFLLAQSRAGVLPRVAQSFYVLEKQLVTTSAIWYSAYCYAGTDSSNICDSALISKALWCPHFITFFLEVFCIPGFYEFWWFLSAFYSQSVPDLTTCLELSCQLPGLKTEVERVFILFFSPFFFFFIFIFCVWSTHFTVPSCMNWMHKYGKQLCDISLTLKLLNICFCSVKTLNIPSFILVVCLHVENQEN